MSEIVGHLTINRGGNQFVYEIREGENVISDERGKLRVAFTPISQGDAWTASRALGPKDRPPDQ